MFTINSKYPGHKRLPFVHPWNCRQDFVVFLYPRDKLLFHRVRANMGSILWLAIVNFFEQDEVCAVLFQKTVDIFFILSRSSFHWDGIFNDFTTDLNAVSVVFVQISCHVMDTYQHCIRRCTLCRVHVHCVSHFSIASLIGVDMKDISINHI